jgi:hypothetical protein
LERRCRLGAYLSRWRRIRKFEGLARVEVEGESLNAAAAAGLEALKADTGTRRV